MARPGFTSRIPGLDPKSPAGRLLGAAERAIIDNPTVFTAGILLLLWLILSQLSPYFFTVSNLFEITVQAAVIALIAVGQTFVILSKGIDLSVGAILAASAVTSTMVMDAGYGLGAGVIAGIVVGAFFGAANGVAVGYLRIPPFVATLGMMGIARGYALIITEGIPIFRVADGFE
ncbi:MAG: ABC transporter permease, partial [Rhodospirillales bacterium]|nr:ABC transporter permease [Rhodospirillales bacterium]